MIPELCKDVKFQTGNFPYKLDDGKIIGLIVVGLFVPGNFEHARENGWNNVS